MAAAARAGAARAEAAPLPGATPPPHAAPAAPEAAPDNALHAAPDADPPPLSGTGSAPRGADAADGEAAAAEALGRSTPLAPPAELAARTWADEELRQLALREVQREREEVLHT